jgi:hypothetical protein
MKEFESFPVINRILKKEIEVEAFFILQRVDNIFPPPCPGSWRSLIREIFSCATNKKPAITCPKIQRVLI